MQLEIDRLHRKLRCERHRRTLSDSNPSSSDDEDGSYEPRALNQKFKSQFTRRIERGKLPRWFTQPTFTIYNGRTYPVEHVNHFNQRMAVHSRNEALMCKVFPSSLGLVVMRWFDGLKEGSISSFQETS
nr:hypothetical protein CFP56_33964 [Quercus suber]